MSSESFKIHPSGLFSYRQEKIENNQEDYIDCILLKDIVDTESPNIVRFSCHNEEICKEGTKIEWISYKDGEIYGWINDEIVMDIAWAPQ